MARLKFLRDWSLQTVPFNSKRPAVEIRDYKSGCTYSNIRRIWADRAILEGAAVEIKSYSRKKVGDEENTFSG